MDYNYKRELPEGKLPDPPSEGPGLYLESFNHPELGAIFRLGIRNPEMIETEGGSLVATVMINPGKMLRMISSVAADLAKLIEGD